MEEVSFVDAHCDARPTFLGESKGSLLFYAWNGTCVTSRSASKCLLPEGAASSMRIEEAEKQEHKKMNDCPWRKTGETITCRAAHLLQASAAGQSYISIYYW